MKKYPLHQSSLTSLILQTIITKWLPSNLNQQTNKIKQLLKGPISKLPIIQEEVIKASIQYIIFKIMPWIFQDFTLEYLIKQSLKLKQMYRNMLAKEYFRSKNNFQIFMVYLVKINSLFLEDNFQNILIDRSLEAEICIMLYYTFLGMEINTKTYEVLEKKYLKVPKTQSIHTITTKKEDKKIGMSLKTCKSIYSLLSQSQNYLKASRKLIKAKSKYNHRLSEVYGSIHENSTQFAQLLKANLHVDQLPKVKQSKINIKNFQRIQTLPQQPSRDRQDDTLIDEFIPKQLHSNQLSQAIKSQSSQPLYFELHHKNKNIKFNQSFYNANHYSGVSFHRKTQKIKENIDQIAVEKNRQGLSSPQNDKRISYQQWSKIITTLKSEVYKIKKKKVKYNQENYEEYERKERQSALSNQKNRENEGKKVEMENSDEQYFLQKISSKHKRYLRLEDQQFSGSNTLQANMKVKNDKNERQSQLRRSKRMFLDECNNRRRTIQANNLYKQF